MTRLSSRRGSVLLASSLPIFFASGASALVYQVAWQRMLVIFSGADVHAATIVVAAFMAGLGCGSYAGGQIADRVSRRRAVLLFAAAELAVAAFGFFSHNLFYGVLYEQAAQIDIGAGPTAAILVVALLWPTFLMGASLPLLTRGLTLDVGRAASTVGRLYGVNTLGAALGAACATWLLLPQAGMAGTVRVAAVLNLLCAVSALALAMGGADDEETPAAATSARGSLEDQASTAGASRLTMRGWSGLFAVSGFLALSLEIIWFRMLGVMLKSTSFTFGTLLAVYLAGIGLGAMAGSAVASRTRRPALGFFALQAGAGTYTALSLAVFIAMLGRGQLPWFVAYFGAYDAINIPAVVGQMRAAMGAGPLPTPNALGDFFRLYVVLPAVLIGPPTFMAGLSFPLLQRAVQTDLAHVGRRVGGLLSANILGSTLGAFVTGWFLLDVLGSAGTLRLLFAVSAAFGALALREIASHKPLTVRASVYVAGAICAAGILAVMPAEPVLWARLHGTIPSRIMLAEDGTGVSILKAERPDFRRVVVFVNGLGQSWIPYGDVHTVLGALPAFVHPNPRSAAIIGLGSGDTLFAMAGRPDLDHVTSIEIIAPQLTTLREIAKTVGYPGVVGILNDPRIQHVVGDGRLYLRRAGQRYDIIEADALRPSSAYSGNLYSDAYFRLLRDHLNPGGLAVTWAPTPRVIRTFGSVFPYVWHSQSILMGSDQPIEVNAQLILGRLAQPKVRDYFESSGVYIEKMLTPYLSGPWQSDGRSGEAPGGGDINTDLYPRDEFDIPPIISLPGGS